MAKEPRKPRRTKQTGLTPEEVAALGPAARAQIEAMNATEDAVHDIRDSVEDIKEAARDIKEAARGGSSFKDTAINYGAQAFDKQFPMLARIIDHFTKEKESKEERNKQILEGSSEKLDGVHSKIDITNTKLDEVIDQNKQVIKFIDDVRSGKVKLSDDKKDDGGLAEVTKSIAEVIGGMAAMRGTISTIGGIVRTIGTAVSSIASSPLLAGGAAAAAGGLAVLKMIEKTGETKEGAKTTTENIMGGLDPSGMNVTIGRDDGGQDPYTRVGNVPQKVEPRPTGNSRYAKAQQSAWDSKYGKEYGPDGTILHPTEAGAGRGRWVNEQVGERAAFLEASSLDKAEMGMQVEKGPAQPAPPPPPSSQSQGSVQGTGQQQAQGSNQVDQILATIRKRESGGRYDAQARGSSASGAYQFIDSTWQSLSTKYGVSGFKRASDAPPEMQDKVARAYVEDILKQTGGDVSKVPVVWYTGNAEGRMSQQALMANRGLTAQMYQSNWMNDFARGGGQFQGGGGMGMQGGMQVSSTPAMGMTGARAGYGPLSNYGMARNEMAPQMGGRGYGMGMGGEIMQKPQLTTIRTANGRTAQVGAEYARNFQGFINDLEATGYKIESIGGYADRANVNNPRVKSYHAMGAAIDINPGANPNKSTQSDLPPETGMLAAKWGLGWGMNWSSVKDPMHFSAARDEQGSFDIPRGMAQAGEVQGGAASGGSGYGGGQGVGMNMIGGASYGGARRFGGPINPMAGLMGGRGGLGGLLGGLLSGAMGGRGRGGLGMAGGMLGGRLGGVAGGILGGIMGALLQPSRSTGREIDRATRNVVERKPPTPTQTKPPGFRSEAAADGTKDVDTDNTRQDYAGDLEPADARTRFKDLFGVA